tara:strand:+ start:7028 stop:7774 length:747 start_codon:yes stop_codon:yes gene_type:complete
MSNNITYEHPINERTRILLKLEYLFNHITFENTLETLTNILQIGEISKRFDLRFECLQSLDRILTNLIQIKTGSFDINLNKLEQTKQNVEKQINILKSGKGKFGEYIIKNEPLHHIISKLNAPGGLITGDIPYLKFWFQKPYEEQQKELMTLHQEFIPLQNAVITISQFIKSSATPQKAISQNGTYSKMLDNNKLQLIRISLNKNINAYPEISGNGKFISIRFMTKEQLKDKPNISYTPIEFDISYCF